MDFLLTEEQRMLKNMVEDFGREQIKPVAREHDQNSTFPHEIVQQAGELGLMGVAYPPEYDGSGMDFVSYMLAIEGISRYCAATGVIVSAHSSLCIDPIFRFGTEEQKNKYMPPLCRGEQLGCLCLTEPNAGSDAGAVTTTARLEGDKWVLNGTKQFVTNGGPAAVAVVIVTTRPEAGSKGLSAFIVEKDTPGYTVGHEENKLGIKASSTTQIILEDCAIPKENLLGEENKGFKVALATLDGGRLGIAAQALGIARASIEDAVAYSKDRVQFGKAIAEFQGIQWMLADMATECQAAWLLTYYASLMKDKGLRYSREAAMAKLKASEVSEMCATNAVQIHGGYGYTKEYDPERYFRDSKITQIYEGTSEIQRMVIASWLLK